MCRRLRPAHQTVGAACQVHITPIGSVLTSSDPLGPEMKLERSPDDDENIDWHGVGDWP